MDQELADAAAYAPGRRYVMQSPDCSTIQRYIATHLVVVVVVGAKVFEKAQGSVVSSRSGLTSGRIALQAHKHQLADFWYDVIRSRWQP